LDITLLVKAALMGIVEGLTEFLPISSTGHLILAGSLLRFTGESVKVFEIAIQTGAMLSVIWEYRQRLGRTVSGLTHDPVAQRFACNVLIAFIPAVVLGLAFGGLVKEHLFHPVPVATAFIVGGLIILWVERRHKTMYGERDLERRPRGARRDGRRHDAPWTRSRSACCSAWRSSPAPAVQGRPSSAAWCWASRAGPRPSSASTWVFPP